MKEHRTLGKQLVWFCMAAVLFSAVPVSGEQVTGFVTQIDSPTEFSVGSLRVLVNGKTRCETQQLAAAIIVKEKRYDGMLAHRYFVLRDRPDPSSNLPAPCGDLSLKVGARVHVEGEDGQHGGSFTAAQLIVFGVTIREDFTDYWGEGPGGTGGALLEERPKVRDTDRGWSGSLWVNGYPMNITADTKVLTAPPGTQLAYGLFKMYQPVPSMGVVMPRGQAPAFSASLFQPNAWAAYQGTGGAGDHIMAGQIRLWPNETSAEEKMYREEHSVQVQAHDYASHIAGELRFHGKRGKRTLKILSNRNVQEFVTKLGNSLVPEYQRKLQEQDGSRVHFRFYAVQTDGKPLDDELSNLDGLSFMARPAGNDVAGAFPDGVIVIPDYTLARLTNQAQLASILSSAITVVLQKLDCPVPTTHGWADFAAGVEYAEFSGPTTNGDDRFLFPLIRDEEELRMGIRQMYLAGYDIREAPIAWAAALGKPFSNPQVNPAQSATGIPWYTAYAFDYISQFYSDVDYSRLKCGKAEYAQFLKELRQADPGAFGAKR